MKIEFYIDEHSETRWRALADNHELVAESGKGYTERRDAEHGFQVLREAIIADYLATESDGPAAGKLDIRFVARDARARARIHAHERHDR